jgi:hypothetical protein
MTNTMASDGDSCRLATVFSPIALRCLWRDGTHRIRLCVWRAERFHCYNFYWDQEFCFRGRFFGFLVLSVYVFGNIGDYCRRNFGGTLSNGGYVSILRLKVCNAFLERNLTCWSCPFDTAAYLCYSVVLAGFVYPVVAHSIWSQNGFLSTGNANPLFNVGAVDFAGSGVVHITGGSIALLATLILGPRRGRFYDAQGEPLDAPKPFPGHSMALQLLGTMILWFGCKFIRSSTLFRHSFSDSHQLPCCSYCFLKGTGSILVRLLLLVSVKSERLPQQLRLVHHFLVLLVASLLCSLIYI